MGKQWKQWQFIFLGSKIIADGDCSHEIKRCLLHGRNAVTNLDNILKSRDITLPTKVCLVKTVVFPVVVYGCESWTIKKAECGRIDGFELWCWRRLLRVPWTSMRSNQSFLPGASVRNSTHGKGHEEGGLAYAKAWSSLRKPPVPEHLTPKPESVLCSHLHLLLYGGLSPITLSLGEGVNVQLQGNKNSWAWQECFSLRTPLKVI